MTARDAAIVGVVAIALVGCAMSSPRSDALDSLDALDGPATTSTTAPTDTTESAPTTISESQRECEDGDLATKSLRPDGGGNVDDAFVEEIRQRGVVDVGVDNNTLGFSVRDPGTGEYEGFEVALAHEIAKRIFGDEYEPGDVNFVPVASGQKREFVRNGTVDFTISANTMTCERWEEVLHSTEYYTADQRFLVREDSALRTVEDLAGARVCVTSPSSSQSILERHVPRAELVRVRERIDCLVALQEGKAEAYFGHDSFQYGMVVQDPRLEMRSIRGLPAEVTVSNYGIAIDHQHEGFVRYVNAVLEEFRVDGTWQRLHEQLEDPNGASIPPVDAPPPAEYRD